MFEKGDYIVYGNNGPCMVVDITTLPLHGCDQKKKYYVLGPVKTKGSRIYSPVDNEKVFVRKILSYNEADVLMHRIPFIEEITFKSEKLREEEYKNILKHCDLNMYIGMLKTLAHKKQKRMAEGRKFPSVDERYLKEVVELLSHELALSLGTDRKEICRYLKKEINSENTDNPPADENRKKI